MISSLLTVFLLVGASFPRVIAREWPKSKRARLLFLVGVTPAKQQLPMTPIYLRFKFWQLPILAILAIRLDLRSSAKSAANGFWIRVHSR